MMAHEIAHQDAGAAAIVAELSGAVFTLAVRAHLETQRAQAGVLGLMANPRLAPALAAMLESPEQPWTVESLADPLPPLARRVRAPVRAARGRRARWRC